MLTRLYNRLFFITLLSSFYFLMPIGLQAAEYNTDDSYLQSLSEEADHLEYMGRAEKELLASRKVDSASPDVIQENTRSASTGIQSFESVLKSEYPYTFELYKKLGMDQKQQVFVKIKETRKISAAQTMIIDLYKSTLH